MIVAGLRQEVLILALADQQRTGPPNALTKVSGGDRAFCGFRPLDRRVGRPHHLGRSSQPCAPALASGGRSSFAMVQYVHAAFALDETRNATPDSPAGKEARAIAMRPLRAIESSRPRPLRRPVGVRGVTHHPNFPPLIIWRSPSGRPSRKGRSLLRATPQRSSAAWILGQAIVIRSPISGKSGHDNVPGE